MSDSTDSKESGTAISQTPTERVMVRALLIDVHVKRVVDVLMTPSFAEVEKLVGSSFFVPHRFGALRGDTLYCDEGHFGKDYQNFVLCGCGVTGNGLVVGCTHDHILVDCRLDREQLEALLEWR